jgi:dihydroneopterin aldolase
VRRGPWIVKVGGSLADSPDLARWMAFIARRGGRFVVVPGGGPFADAVREAQRRSGFDDATAHRMAILAMEQYGVRLAAFARNLRPVATRSAIASCLRERVVPVWLPSRMLHGRADVAPGWDVTSDSLAAWLAATLDAPVLVLLKSIALREPAAADELARRGIVDAAFAGYLSRGRSECRIVAAQELDEFAAALRRGTPGGTAVLRAARGPGRSRPEC